MGIGFVVRGEIGVGPWTVLHQGISQKTGIAIGTADVVVSVPVLIAWLPLRQQPGVGTVAAAVLIGVATNLTVGFLPSAGGFYAGVAFVSLGVTTLALGAAIYLSADLGPGPRDGIMTGIHRKYGWSIRSVRTAMEMTVLSIGLLLGGTVGLGTIIQALSVGPLLHVFLHRFDPDGSVIVRRADGG
ncbi:MAG: hypothetical protein V3S62_03740 [Acidimicrobiia bacterium]